MRIKVKVLLNADMIRKAQEKRGNLKCPHVCRIFRDGLQPCSLTSPRHFCNEYIVYQGVLCDIFEREVTA